MARKLSHEASVQKRNARSEAYGAWYAQALTMLPVTASLVVYQTPAAELQPLFRSLQATVKTWVLVDNSAGQPNEADTRKQAVAAHGGLYFAAPRNAGFGAGHNLALQVLRDAAITEPLHLIVNPDIAFAPEVLVQLTKVMTERTDVGWVMPQVRSEAGLAQPLCKLLPTPWDLLGRRFVPRVLQQVFGLQHSKYELKETLETASDNVPFLSGCFIFARRALLEETNGFDARYFMYMEDVDLCRRARRHAKLLYWPEVHVVHGHRRGSYHHPRLTFFHVRSAVRYFSRWGWFFDRERNVVNRRALQSVAADRQQLASESNMADRLAEPHSSAAHR
jgi:GT2 family glycosyltransferase